MNDLLDKLKSLGLKLEKAANIEPSVDLSIPVDEVIQGNWVECNGSRVFVVEKLLPTGFSHGEITIQPFENLEFLTCFMQLDNPVKIQDLLFIDTETSSLSTGAGSFVFLVGLSYFTADGLKLVQIFLDQPQNELPFLSYLDDLLAKFNTFVSYNGKAFDIPMLKSRYILNKLPSMIDRYQHFDLLHAARRIWKLRLESRKLADIEKEILSFTRGEDEIPGWLVPQMYFDYLESNNAEPLKGVFYHNEIDVISLVALLIHINNLLSQQQPISAVNSLDVYSIGYVLGKLKLWDLSGDFYKAGLQKGLPEEYQNEAARNFAFTLKKQQKWGEALEYWKFAADNGDYLSCIELSKYFEHRERDLDQAFHWVETAMCILSEQLYNENEINLLEHRRNRIMNKKDKDRQDNG